MFNKNAKFKLWFWGIVFVICALLGTIGAVKHFKDTKEQRERDRISTKKSSEIIIEGNILSNKSYEIDLKFLVLSILNDSAKYLKYNNNEITLTDQGKLTSTIKYMFLKSEINLEDGVDKTDKDNIVKQSKVLFGDYVKYDDFVINYSAGFCGSSGFDSALGTSFGGTDRNPNANCENPLFIFSEDKFRYHKDTYVVSVKVGYVDETNYVQDGNEVNFEPVTCEANETQAFRTINLYSNEKKSSVKYTRHVATCCPLGGCKSPGIVKISNDLKQAASSLGETYLFRFDKNKDSDTFKLVSIEKEAK